MASNYQLSHLRPCREPNPGLRGGRRECYHSATVTPHNSIKQITVPFQMRRNCNISNSEDKIWVFYGIKYYIFILSHLCMMTLCTHISSFTDKHEAIESKTAREPRLRERKEESEVVNNLELATTNSRELEGERFN